MKVLLFGATGMVGRGVLLECLADGRVSRVVSVVRRPTGISGGKLQEIVHNPLLKAMFPGAVTTTINSVAR